VIECDKPARRALGTIKSHHNVGGLPERMKLKLVEPLRELFKDEVRASVASSVCPMDLSSATPSPVRVWRSASRASYARQARNPAQGRCGLSRGDPQRRALQRNLAGLRRAVADQGVGVMGDARSYDFRLRFARGDLDRRHDRRLFRSHTNSSAAPPRIINEVRGINRVVYDVTSKPPGTIEWE
jgi:GMP synthase (glutamine-hydrolysing)